MGTEKKTGLGSCSCFLLTKVFLPYDKHQPDECEIKHPEPAYLRVGDLHHVDVAPSSVTDLVEGPHHRKVLKHIEGVPCSPARDILDQMGSDLCRLSGLADASLSSGKQFHLDVMAQVHVCETRASLPYDSASLINVVEMTAYLWMRQDDSKKIIFVS